ncbi:MAG: hypothetical protein HY329_14115, partial [Chloroflexi bacterium]|nr:hypothetical protein [Chloroflexota bacterium]
ADQQKIVADAAQNMAKKARKVSRDSQQGARDFMAGQGVTINDVKPEELAKMRSAVRPVYDWAKQQWGDAYVGKVLTAVGK